MSAPNLREIEWAIIDELMDALQVVNRRAYDNVIRKLEGI